jgi:hydroxymethylpyrimidine pyrophosphatase-like HAD family hydrolase
VRDYKLLVVNLDNTLLRSNKTLSPAAVRLIAAASAKGKQVVVCSGRAASEAFPYWGTQPDGSPGLAAAGVRHAILSFGCETWAMGATPEQSRATCRTLLAPRMVRCVMDVLRNRDLLVQAVMDDGYFHASERMDTMVRLRDQPGARAARSTCRLAFRRIKRGHEKRAFAGMCGSVTSPSPAVPPRGRST